MRISDWSSDVCSSDLLDADHLAVIFDADRHNFRNEIYPAYKAQRPEAPEDLVPQFPLIREATRAFNVPCIEKEGFEADDLIATYATTTRDRGWRGPIVTPAPDMIPHLRTEERREG